MVEKDACSSLDVRVELLYLQLHISYTFPHSYLYLQTTFWKPFVLTCAAMSVPVVHHIYSQRVEPLKPPEEQGEEVGEVEPHV